jgi:cytochrome P450
LTFLVLDICRSRSGEWTLPLIDISVEMGSASALPVRLAALLQQREDVVRGVSTHVQRATAVLNEMLTGAGLNVSAYVSNDVQMIIVASIAACVLLLALRSALSWLGNVHRWVTVAARTRHIEAVTYDTDAVKDKNCIVAFIERLLSVFLGQALTLAGGCPWEHMYRWVTDKSLVKFRVAHRTGIIVGDPAGLKRVFQTGYKRYDKDLDFSYGPFLPILGSGLVTANGAHWQKQRLLMAPALRVDMLDAILPIALRAVERLSEKLDKIKGKGVAVDIEEEFRLLTLQVIGEAILSLGPEECDEVFPSLYLPVMEESNKRVLQPWRYLYPIESFKYNSRVHQLDTFIKGVIRKRREERERTGSDEYVNKDILDKILDSVDKERVPWNASAETQLCFEIKTFLLAGHETSAAMLTWSVFELAKGGGQDFDKVRKEAKSHLSCNPELLKRENVEKMDWTLSCLKESLRKYSVVPVVTRDLNCDDELCGVKLPRGSWIICHLQRVHHLYKDPLSWKPDRFMPGGEYDSFPDDIRPYMFVPFIQGPRNCLGQYFALIEARVVLGSLCERFRFKLVDPATQGVTHPTVIPVGPVGGMPVFVE